MIKSEPKVRASLIRRGSLLWGWEGLSAVPSVAADCLWPWHVRSTCQWRQWCTDAQKEL